MMLLSAVRYALLMLASCTMLCCHSFLSAAQALQVGTPIILNQVNCNNLTISPDATYLLSIKRYGAGIQVWDRAGAAFKAGAVLGEYGMSSTFPQRFAISPNSQRFVVYNTDYSHYVFDRLQDGSFRKTQHFTALEDITLYLEFSPDGKYLIVGNDDQLQVFSNDKELTLLRTLPAKGKPVFIPKTDLLIIDDQVYQWKQGNITHLQGLEELAEKADIRMHFAKLVLPSPDGSLLLLAYGKKVALLARQGKQWSIAATLAVEEEWNTAAFSPNQQYIVAGESAFQKSKLWLYTLSGGQLIPQGKYSPLKEDYVASGFTQDGGFLVAGTESDIVFFPLKGMQGNVAPARKTTQPIVKKETTIIPPTPTPTPKVIDPQPQPGSTSVQLIWLYPNPDLLDGKPLVTNQPTLDIQLKIISPQPINETDITILINQKKAAPAKFREVSIKQSTQKPPSGTSHQYTFSRKIMLENGKNEIEVTTPLARTPQKVTVLYNAGRPSLHVLAIGTSLDLQFPQKDANDFANLFKTQGGAKKVFANATVKTLTGKAATTNAIKEAIEHYRYEYKNGSLSPQDVLLVFISSHGFLYQGKLRIQGDDYKELYKETYSIAYDEIVSRLNEVECKKLIFLDACFSGGAKAGAAEINNAIAVINQQQSGTTTLSSCSEDEYSYEDPQWNNGAFTKAILQGCATGAADADKNGLITIEELYRYVRTMVPKMVQQVKGKSQNPTMPKNDLLGHTVMYALP